MLTGKLTAKRYKTAALLAMKRLQCNSIFDTIHPADCFKRAEVELKAVAFGFGGIQFALQFAVCNNVKFGDPQCQTFELAAALTQFCRVPLKYHAPFKGSGLFGSCALIAVWSTLRMVSVIPVGQALVSRKGHVLANSFASSCRALFSFLSCSRLSPLSNSFCFFS